MLGLLQKYYTMFTEFSNWWEDIESPGTLMYWNIQS